VSGAKDVGVLLVNLGSPQAATRKAVARFLRPFLLDRRVVELPRLLWWPLLQGVIIPLRAGRVARAYQSIWQEGGSPLRCYTERLAARVQEQAAALGQPLQVRWAMTYGEPGIAGELERLQGEGIETIVVVPLFPQYSATTTGAVYDQLAAFVRRQRNIPDLRVVKRYANLPEYIAALASSVRAHWRTHGRGERLLMSFHGIPQRCADRGDPYPNDCETTARLLAETLQLAPRDWLQAYQSRFGRQQWLLPDTESVLAQWARSGVGSVDVICPAFATDCLETLEEIGAQNAERFCAQGGRALRLIPCLNDSREHARALHVLIHKNL